MTIFWKIIVVILVLAQTSIGAYLGWRVLMLMKRVKLLQEHRRELIHSRAEWEVKMLEIKKKKIVLSELEKKMILAAPNMPEYGKAITDPKTSFQMRKVYRDLIEKIKESLKD